MHTSSIVSEDLHSDVETGLNFKPTIRVFSRSANSPPSRNGEVAIDEKSIAPARSIVSQIWSWVTQKSGDGQIDDVGPAPDGGFTAWTMVLMCHNIGCCTWGFLNAFGIFQTYYVTALNRPPADISWIGSIQGFCLFAVSTFSGRLSDAGYFHQVVAAGTILQLFGIFAASFSTTYWQLLLSHGVCVGLGAGLYFCPTMSVVGTYFSKRQSMALSFASAGSSTGGLIFAAALQNVLPQIGFPWAMRVCGFLMLALLIPANFLLKPRQLARLPGPLVDWSAFKEPAYSFFAFGMFFLMLGIWFPFYYLGSFGRNVIGISGKDASSLILIINGVGLSGRILPAIFAPRVGPVNLLVPLSFLSAVLIFAWVAVTDRTGLIIFDVFFGIMNSAAQGMFPPSLGSLTTDMSKMGVRMGMVFSVMSISLLIGTPLAGAIISSGGGGYRGAQIYAGSAMMLGVALLWSARVCAKGWGLFVRV